MTISSILARLDKTKRTQIDYAFEEGLINQYVEYEPGRFIGVNIQHLPHLLVEQIAGCYAEGSILQGQVRLHK